MNELEQRMAKLGLIQEKLAAINLEVKANEAMSSAQAGYGDEFVPTDLASQILMDVRDANSIFSKLATPVNMPTNPYVLPVEGSDPTFYAASESTGVAATEYTNSKAGTDDLTLTAKKFTAVVYETGELSEDSIVNMENFLRTKLSKSYIETIDNVILNGDTTTGATGNVNKDDGAPTAGTAYLHLDGLRKHAIANSLTVNAGGAATDLTDLRAARAKLGIRGTNPADLLWVVGYDVYFAWLNMAQVETMEKFGNRATVVEGRLVAVDGIEVLVSGQCGLAEADGKQSATGSNNTLGTAHLVYKPDVLTGFRRSLQIFPEYLPRTDQYAFSAHFRYAQAIKGTAACASIINILV